MALHSFLKGTIRFGLIDIQVRFYPAAEDRPLELHFLHKKCRTRVRQQRYCPICEEEVHQEEIVPGYPISREQHLVLEGEDFEKAETALFHSTEIIHFVHLSEVDPIYYDQAYYMVPETASARSYALLRDAMRITGKAAIGHIALHEKGSLALLRPFGNAIALETLYYPDRIRPIDYFSGELPGGAEPRSDEMEMALELMNRLSSKFTPDQYKDTCHEQILHLIHPKVKKKEGAGTQESEAPVLDLKEALKASLRRARTKGKAVSL